MQTVWLSIRKNSNLIFKLVPLAAFGVPLLWLYLLEPATFDAMWKGRTFQLFFIWLLGLELILDWETVQKNSFLSLGSIRIVACVVSTVLPTLYVASSYYWGLNSTIIEWAKNIGITWAISMPLSIEYIVFGAMFTALVLLLYGLGGLKAFSVPAFFLFLVGAIYTIDNVYPYGTFAPFQIFVPTTTTLAAAILNLMGYNTSISYEQSATHGTMPILTATNPHTLSQATFSIAWPCAGIESFLIFTIVTLLFLKRMNLSFKSKVGFFIVGAAVTYLINSFRIVSIFTTGIIYGENSAQVQNIHYYYGPLYAVTWIALYPLIIISSQELWKKMKAHKNKVNQARQVLPSPA